LVRLTIIRLNNSVFYTRKKYKASK
jgi:hypothetical protein